MTIYRVEFFDRDENVYATEEVERDNQDAFLAEVRARRSHDIGAGFDIWDGPHLIHRHRNNSR